MTRHKYYLGKADGYDRGRKNCECYLTWKFSEDAGTFSMSAEMWQPNKADCITCGQCVEEIAGYFPEDVKAQRMLAIWRRWHLNNLNPGCEHQRNNPAWDVSKKLQLVEYSRSEEFYKMREQAEDGELTPEAYENYSQLKPLVDLVLFDLNCPKFPFPHVQLLLDNNWIVEDVKERGEKAASWVTESEHPEGLLCKPCEVCGYKYGTAWLKEELPIDVVTEIKSW